MISEVVDHAHESLVVLRHPYANARGCLVEASGVALGFAPGRCLSCRFVRSGRYLWKSAVLDSREKDGLWPLQWNWVVSRCGEESHRYQARPNMFD